jgi:hypothetical protein
MIVTVFLATALLVRDMNFFAFQGISAEHST